MSRTRTELCQRFLGVAIPRTGGGRSARFRVVTPADCHQKLSEVPEAVSHRAELVLDDVEDYLTIDPKVFVHDDVAQTSDRCPRDVGDAVACLVGSVRTASPITARLRSTAS